MLSLKYSSLQALYWSTVGVLMGYSVSFLQAHGFSNSEIGIISSIGDILALSSAIIVSAEIDKKKNILRKAGTAILLIQISAVTILIVKPSHDLITALCALLASSGCLIINPLYIKLALDLNANGEKLSFGTSRGFGSIAFAVAAWLMGMAAERWNISLIPICAFVLLILQGLLFRSFPLSIPLSAVQPTAEVRGTSLAALLRRKGFSVLLIGLAVVFAANNSVNNYMINVVRGVGGSYATLGSITFVLALVEFPAMFFYSRTGSSKSKRFLVLALIFFPVKLLAIALASSVSGLYTAILLQSLSFGLYTPAIVDYINQSVPSKDSAKAQSLAAMMPSLGTIVITPLSGVLLDNRPVAHVLLFLSFFAATGTLVCLCGIKLSE